MTQKKPNNASPPIWVEVQKTLPQLYGKSPRLDVTVEIPDGRIINVEVQQQPEKDPGRRLRFYTGTMVSHLLQKGVDYDQLPDQVMIYIGTTDIWKQGRSIYEFQMTEIHAYFQIGDGLREIFVNTAVKDGSAISQLMQYFTTADPYDVSQGELSKQVNYYKVAKEGVRIMKSLSQQIFEEGQLQTQREVTLRMAAQGLAASVIAQYVNVAESIIEGWLAEAAVTQK